MGTVKMAMADELERAVSLKESCNVPVKSLSCLSALRSAFGVPGFSFVGI